MAFQKLYIAEDANGVSGSGDSSINIKKKKLYVFPLHSLCKVFRKCTLDLGRFKKTKFGAPSFSFPHNC